MKAHGEHLVVLRRGRLFTVKLEAAGFTPISTVDAFGPDVDQDGAWYDEILVSDGTVVVVGYSYARGGTELGLFDIDAQGRLTYRATYHLRSTDYYSSRNYASRLLGRTLVFYTPLYLHGGDDADVLGSLPAMRKWQGKGTRADFTPIYSSQRLYRPPADAPADALHSVISCELGGPELRCAATGVLGPAGRVFYVSPQAVYVWMSPWTRRTEKATPDSWLYRLPLDGGEPGALRVTGTPIDPFSFLEDDDHLNVLLRAVGRGEAMWQSERPGGDFALLRLPLSRFADGIGDAEAWRYRALPAPNPGAFQNRFVGRHLLYGTGSGWGSPSAAPVSPLFVHRYATDAEPVPVVLGHPVDRIEVLGEDAIVIGPQDRDLHFSSIRLGRRPALAARYTRPEATQGELRSHGFFYSARNSTSGIIGLPIRSGGQPGYRHLVDGSASVLFLENSRLALRELGQLDAQRDTAVADGCRASCVDWYGNARPLFLRGRIFGLLGYEIVEGRIVKGRLEDHGRVSFAPVSAGLPR